MEAFERWLSKAEAHWRNSGRPLVTLSFAQSLDGSLNARRGQQTGISGNASQEMTHRLRSLHQCILVGVGTLLIDDPLLTVRLVKGENPQPVVLDSQLRTPPGARLISAHPKPAWIATTRHHDPVSRIMLENAGARVLVLPEDGHGYVNLVSVLDCLGELGVSSLMVEGGAKVISNFLAQSLVNLVVMTIAPVFLGGQKSLNEGVLRPDGSVFGDHPLRLQEPGHKLFGEDLVIWGKLAESCAI